MNLELEAFEGELRKLREENDRWRRIFKHAEAERFEGVYFICGEGGGKDEMGLPLKISVCPAHGLDGFAIYTKTSDYSAPGY